MDQHAYDFDTFTIPGQPGRYLNVAGRIRPFISGGDGPGEGGGDGGDSGAPGGDPGSGEGDPADGSGGDGSGEAGDELEGEFDADRARSALRKKNQENASLRKRLKDAEPLAKKAREAEEAAKPEIDRLKGQVEQNADRAAYADRLEVAMEVGGEAGLDHDQIRELAKRIRGDDDELAADARKLAALFGGTKTNGTSAETRPRRNLRGGGAPGTEPVETDPAKLAARTPRR